MKKSHTFWPLVAFIVIADWITKSLALEYLVPAHVPHRFIGTLVQFTLTFNQGTAFGIGAGPRSRVILSLVMVVALIVLYGMYRQAAPTDAWMGTCLGLVCGGALGNLIDRIRSPRGVVDFIDVRFGQWHFWTFNVADAGVTVGAILLAILLWKRDRTHSAGGQHDPQTQVG